MNKLVFLTVEICQLLHKFGFEYKSAMYWAETYDVLSKETMFILVGEGLTSKWTKGRVYPAFTLGEFYEGFYTMRAKHPVKAKLLVWRLAINLLVVKLAVVLLRKQMLKIYTAGGDVVATFKHY